MVQASSSITFIGHSTFLIRLGEVALLTDPYYENTLGGIMPRVVSPPIDMERLQDISLITITHTHLDHLSLSTIKKIKGGCPILVPEGTKGYLKKLASKKVREIRWGETVFCGRVGITALPAAHLSARYIMGQRTITNSYLLQWNGMNIYFVGDSGYSHTFKEIGEQYAVDIAILPIGLATPAVFFGKNHLSPHTAIKAFLDLKAKKIIPAHFGTFRTILEDHRWPLKELKRLADIYGISDKLQVLDFGAPWEF